MLASVYSYRVMVKSVSSCCVRGRRVLSNPVTYRPGFVVLNKMLLSEQIMSTSDQNQCCSDTLKCPSIFFGLFQALLWVGFTNIMS